MHRMLVVIGVLLFIPFIFWDYESADKQTSQLQTSSGLISSHQKSIVRSLKSNSSQQRVSNYINLGKSGEISPDNLHFLAKTLNISKSEISSHTSRHINQLFSKLILQGERIVPLITKLLDSSEDSHYWDKKGGQAVNYRSLRMGLINVLDEIGGPLAVATLSNILTETSDPAEIARVFLALEAHAPGIYSDSAMAAAIQGIESAAENIKPDSIKKIGPLFEIIQNYGNESAVPILERISSVWPTYSIVALAKLPDGAGVPSLINRINNSDNYSKSESILALGLLAQASRNNVEASKILIDLAQKQQLSDQGFFKIGLALGGHELFFKSEFSDSINKSDRSNEFKDSIHKAQYQYLQHTIDAANDWPEEAISQRLELIQAILATNPSPKVEKLFTNIESRLLQI